MDQSTGVPFRAGTPLATLLALLLLSLSLKALLLPAPHSTDLLVHRHWKALTRRHPISVWYTETSTPWTLDYPPLFAYFECALSFILSSLCPAQTLSDNLPSQADVTLLRASVALLDPLLLYALNTLSNALHPLSPALSTVIPFLLPGLTLVDYVHFQYNTLPLSLLLLSLAQFTHHHLHTAAILFATALGLKHTLLPLAPPIAVFILSTLYHAPHTRVHKARTLAALAVTTLTTLALPWVPLLHTGAWKPALARMFPLHRGLLHANWAPNAWAVYATVDRVLCNFLGGCPTGVTTGMINNARPFGVLPNPTPVTCALLTLLLMAPFLYALATPSPRRLVAAVAGAGLSAFLAGWHVHEKAVLVPLLPLAASLDDAFVWLSLGGQLALLELLRAPTIAPFLVAHYVAFHLGVFAFCRVPRGAGAYFVGGLVVELYSGVGRGHWLLFGERLPFLPILVVSIYAFAGVAVAYVRLVLGALGVGVTEKEREKVE